MFVVTFNISMMSLRMSATGSRLAMSSSSVRPLSLQSAAARSSPQHLSASSTRSLVRWAPPVVQGQFFLAEWGKCSFPVEYFPQ